MPLLKEELYTIDYIENLPEGERAELIDGFVYDMASPSRIHQRIAFELGRKIADYIDANNGKCEVNLAPFAVFLNNDEYTYVEPDISVVCDSKKLSDKGCHGAPDWIIEIASPASKRMDYMIKLFKYQSAGVREYWIVDSDTQNIRVYDFDRDDTADYKFSDTVSVGIYENLSIDFSKLMPNGL
ncbi:MAG: Uma2 family endonuclease [Lachnospiraceae bacterium]|nr:Uma2 family endonuclease [Lachnospiraceae bacterium]